MENIAVMMERKVRESRRCPCGPSLPDQGKCSFPYMDFKTGPLTGEVYHADVCILGEFCYKVNSITANHVMTSNPILLLIWPLRGRGGCVCVCVWDLMPNREKPFDKVDKIKAIQRAREPVTAAQK